jgi:hypothetical protein
MPPAMGLKKVMFPVGADQGIGDAVERGLGAFLFTEQGLFDHLALNGIAQGSHEFVRLDLAFDEIVLRALLDGLNCPRLIVQAGQQHNGGAGRDCARPSDRLQSFWIGQSQVQQDNVNRMPCKIRLGVRQTCHLGHCERVGALIVEQRADYASLFGVILDQKNCLVWGFSHLSHLGTGTLAPLVLDS